MNSFDILNPEQKEAVLHLEGPLLILAGAGSGKTRALTHRVAYLIEQGVDPWNILAITFTNKAAGEMRERVDQLAGEGAGSVWVSTFHSTCVRILRRHIDRLGYDNSFSIYDGDDSKSLMKEVCKKLQIDTKVYKERSLLGSISRAKDELITPIEMELAAGQDLQQKRIAAVYKEYQAQLANNNALDFDDLIMKTVELFRNCPEVLDYYQERFRYIMVDEYQDTNTAQFQLVRLLADKYRNLCVVGDDDQSIYRFRGANIWNILNFEQYFPEAKVIKLEQNYRSTSNILNAANEVICHNAGRKAKRLWTENEEGSPLVLQQLQSAYEEAEYVIGDIAGRVRSGEAEYKDHAILYRTNAQSRLFEEKLIHANIPYKLIGGVNFYARREIKDILAYLKTIDNGRDEIAIRRIINSPRRGIGPTTLNHVTDYAEAYGMSFYDALLHADEIPGLTRGAAKIRPFTVLIQSMRARLEAKEPLSDLMNHILEDTGYRKELELENTEESKGRLENLDELFSKLKSYEDEAEEPTLSGFLEEVALVADIDNLEEDSNHVVLMTLHSAKGLEFPYVYMTGMEDGLFPSRMAIWSENKEELEEERRLCYVGITRAQKGLCLSAARQRMLHGETQYNSLSRFVKEIPKEYLQMRKVAAPEPKEKKPTQRQQVFQKMKEEFHTRPFELQQPQVTKSANLDYGPGDRVRHIKFGEGTVLDITEGAKDYEVRVNFDTAGIKRLFAAYAKLKKL